MTVGSAAVELENVTVRLGDAEVLRNVSVGFRPARLVGLVGPNGAGKSTLLRAACGLLRPERGRVTVGGRPLGAFSRREMARTLNLLPQSVPLAFAFTVRDVVAMGRHPHLGRFTPLGPADHRLIDWAMNTTDVADIADRPVTELSGGEKQRVLLARSLATEAPILLLDEPTTSLDILHQLEIIGLLERFAAQGKTVVVALHDLNLARRSCSEVILLNRGEVVADGKSEDVLSPEHVASVFGVRADLMADGRSLAFSFLPESRGPRPE